MPLRTVAVLTGRGAVSSPSLTALLERLWVQPGAGEVEVLFGNEPGPDGWSPMARYLVVPDLRRPRFIVPLASRRMATRAVLSYNRLRGPATRWLRRGLAVALTSHADALVGTTMTVWGSPTARAHPDSYLLSAHLQRHPGLDGCGVALGVHAEDPNDKPTLSLCDDHGVVGFVKVGWTQPTARLVRNEARALRSLSADAAMPLAPRLLGAAQWRSLDYAIIEPMPAEARQASAPEPPSEVLLAVRGPSELTDLESSRYWADVLETLASDVVPADLFPLLDEYAAWLAEQATEPLAFGRWHGDLVPWNLAITDRGTFVFDWEHSSPCAPWGFDAAHWSFQRAFVQQGLAAEAAADRVDVESRRWPALGVEVGMPRLVVSLYLLEMALRTLRLRHDGGAWNRRLYPDLFTVLECRMAFQATKNGNSTTQVSGPIYPGPGAS